MKVFLQLAFGVAIFLAGGVFVFADVESAGDISATVSWRGRWLAGSISGATPRESVFIGCILPDGNVCTPFFAGTTDDTGNWRQEFDVACFPSGAYRGWATVAGRATNAVAFAITNETAPVCLHTGEHKYLTVNVGFPGGPWDNASGWSDAEWRSIPAATLQEMLNVIGTRGRQDSILFAFTWTGLLYLDNQVETTEKAIENLFRLSRELDIPVLLSLADVMWMGNRPDLWNWFDPARPGYNPLNIHNVEWSCFDPVCASRDSWRNWGTGFWLGFPAPNLESSVIRAEIEKRLRTLAPVIRRNVLQLQKEGREYLFAGVQVGWEASVGINAACSQADLDAQQACYGFRSYLDRICPPEEPICLSGAKKPQKFNAVLVGTVQRYLEHLAKTLFDAGLPAERIYTHAATVWENGRLDFTPAAFTPYSRPVWSVYPPLHRNMEQLFGDDLGSHGFPAWGIGESNLFSDDQISWIVFFDSVLNNTDLPRGTILNLYTWAPPTNSPGTVAAIRDLLLR